MTTLPRNLLLFGPLLLAWGLLLVLAGRGARPPVLHLPALAAIPAGAQALVTLDARRLRGTRLSGLLSGRGQRLLGADLPALCGRDPLSGAAEVALATPSAPADGDFGVVVAGTFLAGDLVACASRVIEARGGRPVALREGQFWLITDVTTGSGVVAVREGGPLLFGGAAYVRQMIAAVERRAPSALSDARHVALRSEAGGERALVASVLLSADSRERLKAELGEPASAVAGVVGLGLSASAADPIELSLVAGCDRPASCAGLADALRRALDREDARLLRSLLGPDARPLVQQEGPTAHLRLRLPVASLEALLDAVW